MRRYTTFPDHDVFDGLAHWLPEAEVEEGPKPNPIKPLLEEGPIVSTTIPVTSDSMSIALSTSLAMSEEGSVIPITIPTASVDGMSWLILPLLPKQLVIQGVTQNNNTQMGEGAFLLHSGLCREYPCNPGDLWWHCHNCSSSQQKRDWHLLVEEQ